MSDGKLIIAIGGFRLKHWSFTPLFNVYAVPAFMEAQRAPGNRFAGTRYVYGRHFSLSAWESPAAMRAYAVSPRHAKAMNAARWLGSGPFAHYTSDAPPVWEDALAIWCARHAPDLSPASNPG